MRRNKLHAFSISILAAAALMNPPALWCGEDSTQAGHDTAPAAVSCTMAGTWYGGGADAKYLMAVQPATGGDYSTIAQGAFSQVVFGIPVQTIYSGSIIKGRNHTYEGFMIGMVNKSAGFPAPNAEVWAVHATVRLTDCNTLTLDYDFFGAYMMPTQKKPFLDLPDYVVVPPPFSETYQRMPLTCAHCTQQ